MGAENSVYHKNRGKISPSLTRVSPIHSTGSKVSVIHYSVFRLGPFDEPPRRDWWGGVTEERSTFTEPPLKTLVKVKVKSNRVLECRNCPSPDDTTDPRIVPGSRGTSKMERGSFWRWSFGNVYNKGDGSREKVGEGTDPLGRRVARERTGVLDRVLSPLYITFPRSTVNNSWIIHDPCPDSWNIIIVWLLNVGWKLHPWY